MPHDRSASERRHLDDDWVESVFNQHWGRFQAKQRCGPPDARFSIWPESIPAATSSKNVVEPCVVVGFARIPDRPVARIPRSTP